MTLPVEKRRLWIKSRRQQRKLTRYARLRRQFFRYVLLLCVLSLGVFIFKRIQCHLYENQSGLEIKGNTVASNEQIFSVLRPQIINTPLFLLDPHELENKIQKLSAIKYAFIRRYVLPKPSLKIEVLEEFPWAAVYVLDNKHPLRIDSASNSDSTTQKHTEEKAPFVVAESGRLISTSEFPHIFEPALRIYIDDISHLHLSQSDIQQWTDRIAYISKQMQCPVTAIDMRERHNIKIETAKFNLVLGNTDSALTRRLNRLPSVLEVLANQHKDPVYINLALNNNIPVKLAKKTDKIATEQKLSSL